MMIKSSWGIAIAAASFVLALSPEARKTLRRAAMKGTEKFLDLSDQWKQSAAAAVRNRVPTGRDD